MSVLLAELLAVLFANLFSNPSLQETKILLIGLATIFNPPKGIAIKRDSQTLLILAYTLGATSPKSTKAKVTATVVINKLIALAKELIDQGKKEATFKRLVAQPLHKSPVKRLPKI